MRADIRSIKLSDFENFEHEIFDEEMEFDLSKDQIKHLNPDSNAIFTREKIRRAIRKYGEDGLSIEEIRMLTGIERPAIKNHLTKLIGLREVYAQKKNKKLILYYHNGKPLHQFGVKRLDFGNPIIEASLAQGPKNTLFFHILEKRYTILDGEKAEGAIMIPFDSLDEFIEALQELKENIGDAI